VDAATLVLLIAIIFGLIAGYNAMVGAYQYDPAEAAAILGGSLALLGFLLLGLVLLVPRKSAPEMTAITSAPRMELVRQPIRDAMERYGTITIFLASFAGGFLMSRR
jgi:hypothetical protein